MATEDKKRFSAWMKDVFSGDDIILMIDLGIDDLHKKSRVRLYGVDTPNAIGQGPDTEAGKVRSYVYSLLHRSRLTLEIIHRSSGNSIVGIVEVHTNSETINLNDDLIAKGYKLNRRKPQND